MFALRKTRLVRLAVAAVVTAGLVVPLSTDGNAGESVGKDDRLRTLYVDGTNSNDVEVSDQFGITTFVFHKGDKVKWVNKSATPIIIYFRDGEDAPFKKTGMVCLNPGEGEVLAVSNKAAHKNNTAEFDYEVLFGLPCHDPAESQALESTDDIIGPPGLIVCPPGKDC